MLDQINNPFRVAAHLNRVHVIVMGTNDPVPASVTAFMGTACSRLGLRFAGGCSGMTDEVKLRMLEYFPKALVDFRGLVASGGNRGVNSDGTINIMITDVPSALVAANPTDVLAVSTLPRTGNLSLIDDCKLVITDDNNYVLNPGVHMVVLIQDNLGRALGWDGDIDSYFEQYETLIRFGGWKFGMVVFNGGAITKVEALRAALLGWPVFLITGSGEGRAADQLAEQVIAGAIDVPEDLRGVSSDDFADSVFELVSFEEPDALNRAMVRHGLIVPS